MYTTGKQQRGEQFLKCLEVLDGNLDPFLKNRLNAAFPFNDPLRSLNIGTQLWDNGELIERLKPALSELVVVCFRI